jgi:hypothetical protein
MTFSRLSQVTVCHFLRTTRQFTERINSKVSANHSEIRFPRRGKSLIKLYKESRCFEI